MNRILIIQTAFIGDVILATPVIEALHEKYPLAAIDFLLRKGNEGLLEEHPWLSELLIWDKRADKYTNLVSIIRRIRTNKYDVVINLHRYFNTGFIATLSGAKTTIGFSRNPLSVFYTKRVQHKFQNGIHEIDRNLSLIRHLIKTNKRYLPKLYPSEKDFEKTVLKSPYITISPTSVWFTKQYPPDNWIRMMNLTDSMVTIILLGGKADIEACESIKKQSTHQNVKVLAGKLSFLESAALIKNAMMNFTNDSAPMHLASAVDAPVTAVFCSTIPAFGFGPLSVESYIVETDEQLDCRPCGIHGFRNCPQNHFRCAAIDPERLTKLIPDHRFSRT